VNIIRKQTSALTGIIEKKRIKSLVLFDDRSVSPALSARLHLPAVISGRLHMIKKWAISAPLKN
jgi:hypothetical protein